MELEPIKRECVFALPIALVSTIDRQGVRNLAPYSNLTPVLRSTDLIILASWHRRDTLRNIRANGEFVVSIPSVDLATKVMPTAMHYPPGVDEFEQAGLTPRSSRLVAPPGVAGCLAWLECRLFKQYIEKRYVLIVGQVVRLEIDERVMDKHGGMNLALARPLLASLDDQGVRYATACDLGWTEPYAAMFPSGKDPLS